MRAENKKEMERVEQDLTLARRIKSRCAARLRALGYLTTLIKIHRAGWGENKKKRDGEGGARRDAGKEGKSRCAARLRALVYVATLIKKHRTGWGGKRNEM